MAKKLPEEQDLPYDHPKKRTIVKEPPATFTGDIKMKKIKELLDKVNEQYKLTTDEMVDVIVDEMCGRKHEVEEAENELPSGARPLDEPEEEVEAVKKDIAEYTLMKLVEDGSYRKYFQAMLKKRGIKSPADLSGPEKKAFFSAVQKGWKAGKK